MEIENDGPPVPDGLPGLDLFSTFVRMVESGKFISFDGWVMIGEAIATGQIVSFHRYVEEVQERSRLVADAGVNTLSESNLARGVASDAIYEAIYMLDVLFILPHNSPFTLPLAAFRKSAVVGWGLGRLDFRQASQRG
jgi:hypothetical protein